MKSIERGYTFDDLLVIPAYSETLPTETSITSRFSRNVPLNIPFVSSPMDTVTESRMAIAIAELGGVGVIHRGMSIERGGDEVKKVKRHQSSVILDPYTLAPHQTAAHAENLMREKKISGIPIVDGEGRLVGIFTRRNLQFLKNGRSTPLCEAMTKELITAELGISPKDAEELMKKNRVEKLPLVDKNFRLRGLITAKDLQKRIEFPMSNVDPHGRLYVAGAVGVTGDYLERAAELIRAGADALVVDTSHGHSKNVFKAIEALKSAGAPDLVVGNIATRKAARDLAATGCVDAFRVGIGPGSICTTRIVTGCGVPQLSAVMWVREAAPDMVLIADGGIQYSGDIVKALVAGADSVMMGSRFAGTEESPGEKIETRKGMYKHYRGMGSPAVLKAGGERYGAKAVPEGIEGAVPYKGRLAEVVEQLLGGLRQGMGYTGSRTIAELQDAEFVEISAAGMRESHVHGVLITSEAPNYPIHGDVS